MLFVVGRYASRLIELRKLGIDLLFRSLNAAFHIAYSIRVLVKLHPVLRPNFAS